MDHQQMEARIEELLTWPYRKVIRGDAAQGFLGEVTELPGCLTAGATEAEAKLSRILRRRAWHLFRLLFTSRADASGVQGGRGLSPP